MNVILVQYGNGSWVAYRSFDGQLVAAGTSLSKVEDELKEKGFVVARSYSTEAG